MSRRRHLTMWLETEGEVKSSALLARQWHNPWNNKAATVISLVIYENNIVLVYCQLFVSDDETVTNP
ncbi:hypothetical protein Pmani_027858 [Petrolisthes manimaculis]|uniref:Uncharacterized protein n=1 Tax=Petrolisthes manimaculis TaxID=1843537 RepID=A0AAE1P0J4_9EUCA|nr:hypothetical protein Pmani_027858 [Petrolisthes manimaculis]